MRRPSISRANRTGSRKKGERGFWNPGPFLRRNRNPLRFRREGRNENRDQERKQEGFFTIGDVTNSMIENGTNSMIVDRSHCQITSARISLLFPGTLVGDSCFWHRRCRLSLGLTGTSRSSSIAVCSSSYGIYRRTAICSIFSDDRDTYSGNSYLGGNESFEKLLQQGHWPILIWVVVLLPIAYALRLRNGLIPYFWIRRKD